MSVTKFTLGAKINTSQLWNSPTLMTWLSYSTKALTIMGILPLILRKFTPEEVVLWSLFATVITLSYLADFGFRQTFSRIISFAFGGAENLDGVSQATSEIDEEKACNKPLMTSVVATMMYIYVRLTVVCLFLMATLGSWSMIKPISQVNDTLGAWTAWAIIVVVTTISFFTKVYLNFLEGLNKIALVRRVETLTSLGSILSSIAVLVWAPTLLNVIFVNQFWILVASFRDYYLCKKVEDGLFGDVNKHLPVEKNILKKIWTPAWRSGIGGLMSAGVTNVVSILYAQVGDTESVAAYLLAVRIITQIREIAMAPFYSKLPLMAVYRVQNNMPALINLIKKGMKVSHAVFFLGFALTAFCADMLLNLIHSTTPFVSLDLWALIGLAFFFHRFGAMHIQVYISTNHVITHIADGVSGVIFIISSFLLTSYIGIYAVPVGMLLGYGGFYCWYATSYSYRSIGVSSFWQFEKSVGIPSIIGFVVFTVVCFWLKYHHS